MLQSTVTFVHFFTTDERNSKRYSYLDLDRISRDCCTFVVVFVFVQAVRCARAVSSGRECGVGVEGPFSGNFEVDFISFGHGDCISTSTCFNPDGDMHMD